MTRITRGQQLASRMARAALADTELYSELAGDAGAIRQSFLSVLIVAVLWGIGSASGYLLEGDTGGAVVGLLVTGLWAVLFWLLFSRIALVITRTMAGYFEIDVAKITYLQFVRSIGFAFTPGILIILTPIPFVGQAAVLMAFMWMGLVAATAIQHTMDAHIGLGVMAAFGGIPLGLLISVLIRVYVLP